MLSSDFPSASIPNTSSVPAAIRSKAAARAYPVLTRQADPDWMSQPTGSASATSREPESMLEIVEFPEPPKSSAAEEEKKRAEAGKFFQQWIAALVPDVQHNSVPRVRENGEPVEEKKIRGP